MNVLISFLRNTTIRVVAALLLVVSMLLAFQNVPTSLRWPARLLWFGAFIWLLWTTVKALRSAKFTPRKLAFMVAMGLFYYVVLSFACRVFITIMSARDDRVTFRGMSTLPEPCKEGINALIAENRFNKFDKDIGWVPRQDYKSSGYTISSQGIRSTKLYPLPAPDVEKRILCMGDSFTFGVAVKDNESYPAHAEKLRPGTEWVNLGIPGSCLVQSYQRYKRDAGTFGGKRVVVGFMTNDAQRTVNVFRPLVNADSGCPFTKPFAKYADGRFSIEPNPYTSLDDFKKLLANESAELARLRKLDYLTWSGQGGTSGSIVRTGLYLWESYRVDRNLNSIFDNTTAVTSLIERFMPVDPYGRVIWQADSPGFKAICGMFEEYRKQIINDGREPLFVIIPGPLDVDNFVKGFPCQYTTLVDYFKAHQFPFIDFLPTLLAKHKSNLSTEALFVRSHYQSHINKELAEEVIKALKL